MDIPIRFRDELRTSHAKSGKKLFNTAHKERVFDEDTLRLNGIRLAILSRSSIDKCVEKEGRLKILLRDLVEAYEYKGEEVPDTDKQFLDYDKGDCDYILSKEFHNELKTIPHDNEGEWIAECHNKFSRLFRKFPSWTANSLVSGAINEGIKPDRIFGFALPKESDFPAWIDGIHWPFLLIESKPQSYAGEVGDRWKMGVIQSYGWDQQNDILLRLNLPDPYYFSEHAPLTFGIYYIGRLIRISLLFEVDGKKLFLRIPELDIKRQAVKILRIFAVMKRHADEVYKSVMQAHDEGHWMYPQEIYTSSRQKQKSFNDNEDNNNNSASSKGDSEKSGKSDKSDSGSASDALEPHGNILALYKNRRTRVDLVTTDQQHQYIVKTTRTDLGKREYVVLEHLRALSCVPKVLDKPLLRGENITLTMSYCRGVHPLNFTSPSELQIFMKALLTVMDQVHQHNIVHNDIKENNMLWDNTTNSVYLIDFGFATTIGGETEAYTLGYVAPDQLKTPASDVYSAGIVLVNLILGVGVRSMQQAHELAYCKNVSQAMAWKAKHQAISYVEATLCNEVSLDLARKMIVRDAKKRISIESALKHPFFDSAVPVSPTKRVKKLTPLAPPTDDVFA